MDMSTLSVNASISAAAASLDTDKKKYSKAQIASIMELIDMLVGGDGKFTKIAGSLQAIMKYLDDNVDTVVNDLNNISTDFANIQKDIEDLKGAKHPDYGQLKKDMASMSKAMTQFHGDIDKFPVSSDVKAKLEGVYTQFTKWKFTIPFSGDKKGTTEYTMADLIKTDSTDDDAKKLCDLVNGDGGDDWVNRVKNGTTFDDGSNGSTTSHGIDGSSAIAQGEQTKYNNKVSYYGQVLMNLYNITKQIVTALLSLITKVVQNEKTQ
jgi:hypothetical protein